MNDKSIIGGFIVLLLVVGGVLFVTSGGQQSASSGGALSAAKTPKEALPLAQCLSAKGVTFYGAFWCPHCKAQKALFGDAVTALPYVECSTPDGNGQNEICKEKKVTTYPTWIFADGTTLTGEQSFITLAAKSGCSDTVTTGTSTPSATSSAPIVLPPQAAIPK
jgi:glutaredoxin